MRWNMGDIRVYAMARGGDHKATVVVMPSGRCIVEWPTSVIVYDSEAEARAVHIDHMGGRGEETRFDLQCDIGVQSRAAIDCIQDACENVPFASVGGVDRRGDMTVPDYIANDHRAEYLGAYVAAAFRHYGADWQTCEFGWSPALLVGKAEK